MEIYIEIFILQNVLINLCLLRLVYLTTKPKTTFYKILISSIIGTFSSIFVIIFLENTFIINLIKLITALIMIYIAFIQTKKQFLFNVILLFLYTYTFVGIITTLTSSNNSSGFRIIILNKLSVELICLLFIVFTYLFEIITKHLKLKFKTTNLIYDVILTQNSNSIKINAYMDTGNFINHNGSPVLILNLDSYLKLTKTNLINFLSQKTETIKTKTISGQNNLKIIKIDKLEIKNGKKLIKLSNPLIAISTTCSFNNTNYQALLSPLFL